MTAISSAPGVGPLLRDWRSRRRLSQMELALDAEVSARHISFVETGRSKPSRELVLHLAEHLEVPLRERNALLLAAGYAPAYAERPLGDDAMAPVRDALERLLKGHEPFPAVAVDRQWELVAGNAPALAMLDGVAPELLEPPANTLRISLHPRGLAPRIVNLAEYSSHLLGLVAREAAATADPALVALHGELSAYPGVDSSPRTPEPADSLFMPLRLRTPDGKSIHTFFSTIARFGTALDVTVAELSIESFFPADKETAEALRKG
jgi:transcriptional regulator with XRE-family HTH domain